MTRIIRSWRYWLMGLLSFCLVFLLAACSIEQFGGGQGGVQSGGQNQNPGAAPVLRIAVDPTFAPFEMKSADGTLTGFDIDLINAIGGSAGFLIDFDEMSFADLIRNLYAGQADAAISAITITADRAKNVAFSRPYFKSGLAIAVTANNTDITSLETLRGKQIAVQRGTTGETKAQAVPETEIITKATAPEALQALVKGEVDAVINDAPVTAYAITNGSAAGLKLVGELLTEEFYGIATPKNSPVLEQINQGLAAILSNGTYAQIYRKWFTAEPPTLPEAVP